MFANIFLYTFANVIDNWYWSIIYFNNVPRLKISFLNFINLPEKV